MTLTSARRFDVALRHGLASFVCDYLAEVCGDPLTSADPVRAYLLDGRCVADWSQKALQRTRSSVRQVRRLSWHHDAMLVQKVSRMQLLAQDTPLREGHVE